MRQVEQCWKEGADIDEFAREHQEFARAFESFTNDADQLYPEWRQKLKPSASVASQEFVAE